MEDLENLSAEEAPESLNFISRTMLVFTDPAKAFSDIVAKPAWIGAFLLVTLFAVVSSQVSLPYMAEARRAAMMQNPNIDTAQAEAIMERMGSGGSIGARVFAAVATVVGLLIFLVIVAAVLMFGGNFLLGGETTFRTVLAVTVHSWLVTVPKVILTAPLILIKQSMSVSTSLQVLIPFDRWFTPLGAFLGMLDLFSIWMIILLVIGLSTAYGFSRGKSAGLVLTLYVLMGAVGVALAAIGSSFMGAGG